MSIYNMANSVVSNRVISQKVDELPSPSCKKEIQMGKGFKNFNI